MFRFLPYLLKNLWGHRTRSLLTVSGAAVALFVFCFVGAIQEGLDRLTQDRQAERTLVVFQENRFCPITSQLPEDYAPRIAKINGVRDVVPIQVFTNNCRASLYVVVFHGLPPEKLKGARQLQLVAGDWAGFDGRSDAALVGANIAQQRGLSPGMQFKVGEVSVHIAGVFRSAIPAEESLVYVPLGFLQRSMGAARIGQVTQFEVQLRENADPETVAAAIDETFHAGPAATTSRRKGVFQTSTLADLVDLVAFAHWLGYGCLGLVLSLVGTTTVMAVQDRVRQHAVLETLGVRPDRLFRLVVAESSLVCLLGGLIGTLLALLALYFSRLSIGIEGITIAFRPSIQLGVLGLAISLVVGIVAGAIPAWQAARIRVVDALRRG